MAARTADEPSIRKAPDLFRVSSASSLMVFSTEASQKSHVCVAIPRHAAWSGGGWQVGCRQTRKFESRVAKVEVPASRLGI
jgi:hypothetical protein